MRFNEAKIKGVYNITLDMIEDERGFFARSFCRREFEIVGLEPCVAQCNISFNKYEGTLRGMHFQRSPHAEAKLIRCSKGAIYDVIIDLRPDSPTYCQWLSFELSEQEYQMIYIPKGIAHGFQTLANNTEIIYQMSEYYFPVFACGVRWNDPAFSIDWPLLNPIINRRDSEFPLWKVE